MQMMNRQLASTGMRRFKLLHLAALRCGIVLVAVLGSVGCDNHGGGQPAQRQDTAATKIVVYCGRSTMLVGPVLASFTEATGIAVELKDGSTTDLAALLKTEGALSPADVFWGQDPSSLGDLAAAGLLAPLPKSVLSKVPAKFAGPNGRWVATSGRARVLAYAPSRVALEELPGSVFDLTDSRWHGRVGWAPSNGSFLAFLTALRAVQGEDKARTWVAGLVTNSAKAYAKNTPIIEALAAGEIDVGLVNHYYLLRFKDSEGADYPVEQMFFDDGDIGNLIMVSGAGVVAASKHQETAARFIAYLLSQEAQLHFVNEVFEYPVVPGIVPGGKPHAMLIDPEGLAKVVPNVKVGQMSDVQGTKQLLRDAGVF
jgi:iron(III) transport system substrate-binding protein